MSHRSSCSAIAKKPEFSDCAVNCMGVPVYPPLPPKLPIRAFSTFTQSPLQLLVMRLMTRTRPFERLSLTECPCSSQSIRVKSLNVEPAGKPFELPYL